jgi:predicted ArsR family transcriptional regulator
MTAATAARFVHTSETAGRAAIEQLHTRGILEPYAVPGRGTGRPRRWWLARELADLVRV